MKKKYLIYIAIISILTIGIFVLSGCQKEESTTNEVENTTNSTSLRNQIMSGQSAETQNTVIGTGTSTKLEDLEKYNKEEDASYKTYTDSEGVSFMYPSNWLTVGTETEPAFMSPDGKGSTVNISKDTMSQDTTVVTDFDSYMGFQKLYLRQNMTMLSDINEKQVNLNGKKAYILNYIAETQEQSMEIKLNITQTAFLDEDNKVYILTLAVMDDYYKDYQQIFEKMTKSFIKE